MNGYARYLPFGVAAAAVVYFLCFMQPPTDPLNGFHLHDFAMLPVEDDGRVKPIDSAARNALVVVSSGHQTYVDADGKEQPAVHWMLDVMSEPRNTEGAAEKAKVFRIDNDQLLKLLNLPNRPGSYRYALEEFAPHFLDFVYGLPEDWFLVPNAEKGMALATYEVADHAQAAKGGDDAPTAQATVTTFPDDGGGLLANVNRWRGQIGLAKIGEDGLGELPTLTVGGVAATSVDLTGPDGANRQRLLGVIVPQGGATWFYKLKGPADLVGKQKAAFETFVTSHHPTFEKWMTIIRHSQQARNRDKNDRDAFDDGVVELANHLQTYVMLRDWSVRAVPPEAPGDGWKLLSKEYADYRERLEANDPTAKPHPMLLLMREYAAGDVGRFNQTLDDYRGRLEAARPADAQRTAFETAFNDAAPFYWCAILYVVVFALTCLSWIGWSKPLNWSAFALAVVTLVVHTGALLARMYIMNRPGVFVTNLYSTAVFIGWVCVVAGLVFEAIYRNGIGNFVGSVAGFATMIIAHLLAIALTAGGEGDTLGNLRAVLDTNFWLATHVTAVNAGYAATFVAGLLGTLFVIRGVFTPSLNKGMVKTLGDAIYGAVCFATLFSFTGTVLGGIWADQSWGRFWGWDPKENGALIIVVWNALILHARWGGMVKQRGMAVLTLVGNIVTAWSWFGVNLLGIGLHAYGFQAGTAWVLAGYAVSQLVLIGVGLTPRRLWRSFAAETANAPPLPAQTAPNGRTQPARGKTGTGVMPNPA